MNSSQKEAVTELLEIKMKKYKKPILRLRKIHETICKQAEEKFYIENIPYEEFKDIFEKTFVKQSPYSNKVFAYKETGWWDVKKTMTYDNYDVTVTKKPKKTKALKPVTTVNSTSVCK